MGLLVSNISLQIQDVGLNNHIADSILDESSI